MTKSLHIVSFNVPYPADYGGVIDVFYRLRSLAEMGVRIKLHTFTYGRAEAQELKRYCEEVTYYRRDTSLLRLLSREPYIVSSRRNIQLVADLKRDDEPVLLEGLHCCAMLDGIDGGRCYVRAHNVEHDYYARLAEAEPKMLRRAYLNMDARKLRRYEPQLLKAAAVLAVTEADAEHFRKLGCKRVVVMPSSHLDDEVVSQEGRGDYAFYHADLSVAENICAVKYLVEQVFSGGKHRLVVAGRNPAPELVELLNQCPQTELVANPDDETMHRLLADAQVNVLVTRQPTGLKLKLLNSLYAGRHCLVNPDMVAGTELGALCTVADSPEEQRAALDTLMETPFTSADIERRKTLLGAQYSNAANARILYNMI